MSALREQSIGPGLEPELYKEFRLFGTVGKALSTQLYLPGGQKETTGRRQPWVGLCKQSPERSHSQSTCDLADTAKQTPSGLPDEPALGYTGDLGLRREKSQRIRA